MRGEKNVFKHEMRDSKPGILALQSEKRKHRRKSTPSEDSEGEKADQSTRRSPPEGFQEKWELCKENKRNAKQKIHFGASRRSSAMSRSDSENQIVKGRVFGGKPQIIKQAKR